MRSGHIHVWAPGVADTGGIQHYSWCLAKALRDLFPRHLVTIFSRRDEPGFDAGIPGVEARGYGRIKKQLGHACYSAAVARRMITQKPDLCIATHPAFAKVSRWLVSPRRPCLAAAHGIDVWGESLQQLRGALSHMTGLIPVSEFSRNVMITEGGLDPSRMCVVPDTFREEAFTPGPKPAALLTRYHLRPDQPVLLTVGRLAASEAYKGHDQVIAALALIRRAHPDVRYIIAGTGDDEPRLRECVKQHRQEDAVIFAGFVPDAELADHYRLCDAFVMPSTGEGFGIVYLEALASGRPCIVGNRDASPEAIGHGRLGFAIDPRSPEQIADAVGKLLRRDHDKPWLHEPETLHREIVRLYGFTAFKRCLATALHQLVPHLEIQSLEAQI